MKTGRAVLVLFLAVGPLAGPARAEPGATQDPNDTSYKNDIRAVFHDDSGSTITYYLQFYDAIDPADWRCYLGLDFNEDAKPPPQYPGGPQPEEDAHIDFTIDSGTVADSDYSTTSAASVTRAPVGSPHSAGGSTAQNTLKISVSKEAYVEAGMSSGDTGYKYAVGCGDANPPGTWGEYPDYGDRVPDQYESYPIVHTFGSGTAATPKPPAPEPTPVPGTAEPAPGTAATAPPPNRDAPPPPTLESTVEGTESTEQLAESFGSPLAAEEASGRANTIGVLVGAAAAVGLATVGGVALARRRIR